MAEFIFAIVAISVTLNVRCKVNKSTLFAHNWMGFDLLVFE